MSINGNSVQISQTSICTEGLDIYNSPNFNKFGIPSLFSKLSCTFNANSVLSQKTCKQVETLCLSIDRLGVNRHFCRL